MREIKFRVWDTDLKKMFNCGQFLVHSNGGGCCCCSKKWLNELIDKGFTIQGNHKDKILMQYTGLKDKNSVEIYEGDIVEITDGDGWVIGKYVAKMNGEFLSAHPDTIGAIIGNIHQNPELLEAK